VFLKDQVLKVRHAIADARLRVARKTKALLHKRVESEMSYLTQVVNQRPMLRITAEVVLVFCCATPLVLAFSSIVAYGVHSVMH
jgi:hypothetical protein